MTPPVHSETYGIRCRKVKVDGDMNLITNGPTFTKPPAGSKEKRNFRFNVPVAAPHFKGRQEILDSIACHLDPLAKPKNCLDKVLDKITECYSKKADEPESFWEQTVAIYGLGGIGKSELACQFAKKHQEIYPNTAWIDTGTEENALSSFLGLAKKLGIVDKNRQKADLVLVQKVYSHIDGYYSDKVLFIFDNAIQLDTDDNYFGISDFLPQKDSVRLPYFIITSQTDKWPKDIPILKLGELSEVESVDVFRSYFKVSVPSECDQAFRQLHGILQGYPLALNLAASQIEYNNKEPTFFLKKAVSNYIERFLAEDSTLLTEKMNKHSTSKYNKTLSTVWQLSFQILEAEPNGKNAVLLLRSVSFFHTPVNTFDLQMVLTECPFCPGTPEWIKFDHLLASVRLLGGLCGVDYSIDMDYVKRNSELVSNSNNNIECLPSEADKGVSTSLEPFLCELRVHRLVQLVVRLQMDCSPVLEDILRYLAFWSSDHHVVQLDLTAVEKALERNKLTHSHRALTFLGLLACRGNRTAQGIVKSISIPTDPAPATIWRLYNLSQGLEILPDDRIDVLTSFIELSTPEVRLVDKRCLASMALEILLGRKLFSHVKDDGATAPGIRLQSLKGIEGPAIELFSTTYYLNDACSQPSLCHNWNRSNTVAKTVQLGGQMVKEFTKAQLPEKRITPIREMLLDYCKSLDK